MKKLLLATAALGLIASAPVWANPVQIGNTGPASQVYGEGSAASASDSHATSGSISKAGGGTANVVVNVAAPTAGAGRGTSGGSGTSSTATDPSTAGKGRTSGAASGGSNGTARPTARSGGYGYGNGGGDVHYSGLPVSSAVSPNISTFNSCAGSPASGSLQTGPFGISFGAGNKFDRVCWLNESGRRDAAIEYICLTDPTARAAMKNTAEPCAADRPKIVPINTRDNQAKDFCFTASAGERQQHRECDGVRYE